MDTPSICFLGAFLGSFLGLPGGFMLIEAIKHIVSRREEKSDEQSDLLDWALKQRGCKVIIENQIADNWVKTYDIRELETMNFNGDWVPSECELPGKYITQIVGSVEALNSIPSVNLAEANANHSAFIDYVRKQLKLPKI